MAASSFLCVQILSKYFSSNNTYRFLDIYEMYNVLRKNYHHQTWICNDGFNEYLPKTRISQNCRSSVEISFFTFIYRPVCRVSQFILIWVPRSVSFGVSRYRAHVLGSTKLPFAVIVPLTWISISLSNSILNRKYHLLVNISKY